jgi:hypothetical protein
MLRKKYTSTWRMKQRQMTGNDLNLGIKANFEGHRSSVDQELKVN